jgi:Sulfotransferase domain
MHVIGAGLPRTGTLTQKLAIEQLGLGPCYHWVDVLADLNRVEQWDRALNGEAPWGEIFTGYRSTVDWPGGFFYRELSVAYPDAKVVLSVRDSERWAASFSETILKMCFGDNLIHHLSAARATIDPQWERYLRLVDRMFWTGQGTFASGGTEPRQLIDAMERHHDAVKRDIAPERLLVWDVSDGWGPLCEFLELPVPDEPLPHANDRETFVGRVADAALNTLQTWQSERLAAA